MILREREREGGLALDAATMPPPSAENATFRTLPPSDSHCHGVLLLHAACTALSVLPPPIFGQPILGITLFPLCNLVKRNMYSHV